MSCDITRCSDSGNIYDFSVRERKETFLDPLKNAHRTTKDHLRREQIFKDMIFR